jgi:hypothetical protein
MVQYQNYVAGWLDTSIHDFLGTFPPTFANTKYALVSCIDSNRDVSSLLPKSPELKPLATRARALGKGLLVPTKLLLEVDSSQQLFFGFDEVWFFPSKQIEAKPESAWLVGPARMDQRRLDDLGRWMSNNSCSLALGDGEGLNYIVKAQGLVKQLLGHSIEQPEPTMTPFETADSAR